MTSSLKHALSAAAIALLLSLSACGGSDEEDVRAASEDFVTAFQAENWRDVCSLMTVDSRAELAKAGEILDAKGGCEEVWAKASKFIGGDIKRELDDFEIESVMVDGDTATVVAANAKGEPTRLRKEDGQWRVAFEEMQQ